MNFSNVFSLLCGMALFLFGMSLMGDGLKRTAGGKFELLLAKLTDTSLKGLLLGTGVTAIIQSSSATSVMAVGFVNSGMMKFRRAIPIVLGAILGTSITGWVICLSEIGGGEGWISLLSTKTLTGIIALVGIFIRMFKKKYDNVGDIMLGFAVLMVGMSNMSGAVDPLKESPAFIEILTMFSNPVIGILVGIVFTAILQSASASVGILQALSVTGAISFHTALPILFGISIGAALPVLLSAISANTNGRRTAWVYLIISVLGVVVCAPVFYILDAFVHFPFTTMTMNTVSIALANTVFRFFNVVALYPFIAPIDKMTCLLIKEKEEGEDSQELEPIALDERFLPYPALAISQSQKAVFDMALTAQKSIHACFDLLRDYDEEKFAKVQRYEKLGDLYEDSIGTYLMKLSKSELNNDQSNNVFKYLHSLSYLERLTDHAMIIGFVAKDKSENGIVYSEDAQAELAMMEQAVTEIVGITVDDFIHNRWRTDGRVSALTMVIRSMCSKAEVNHVERLQSGVCTIKQGTEFNELLTNFERIAVHCSKVIFAMIEAHDESYSIHVDNLGSELKASLSDELIEEYRQKYSLKKNDKELPAEEVAAAPAMA
ncbi:MAG: Na/Pi cotransporter family protein [Clostridia bacterium]|nr:Na/Pi cotransporter family protein [Clostridia bacterium]